MSTLILNGILYSKCNNRIYSKGMIEEQLRILSHKMKIKDRVRKINKLKDRINEHKT